MKQQRSGARVAGSIEAGLSSITKNGLGHAVHEFHDHEKPFGNHRTCMIAFWLNHIKVHIGILIAAAMVKSIQSALDSHLPVKIRRKLSTAKAHAAIAARARYDNQNLTVHHKRVRSSEVVRLCMLAEFEFEQN